MANFEEAITRRKTGSLKWDRRPDLDPLWVADMDFTSPPAVIEALRKRVDHGVFGYGVPHASLIETLLDYLQRRIGVQVSEEAIVHLGGLVPALSLGARAFGSAGDAVMTCTPVYPPFLGIHRDASMELQTVDHCLINGSWSFDWDAMEKTVTPKTKIFILSNPANPLGRAFSSAEITQLAEFCERHDLILLSDEIHCDLIFDEENTPHFSALNLPDELRKRTITLLAPSKTYNIAGLGYAFAVIPDEKVRKRFNAAKGHTLAEINCLAYYAAEAAYKDGEPWRQELLAYLRKNRDLLTSTLRNALPGIAIPDIEATYLAWIDCRPLEIENPTKKAEDAGLYLSDGAFFGHRDCVRINFGTQTDRLENALETLIAAVRS
ncbi:MAG: PatB family C-S lyase [Akkermansiaceae bacterium]|nr:PatB family C-S lyase [Akkermansiaceae bacterium]